MIRHLKPRIFQSFHRIECRNGRPLIIYGAAPVQQISLNGRRIGFVIPICTFGNNINMPQNAENFSIIIGIFTCKLDMPAVSLDRKSVV